MQIIDRDGLLKVNSNTFSFIEVEMKTRHHLINIFNGNSQSHKESIIHSLITDEGILFAWMFVSREPDEDESTKLLHVIEMWLTIRGLCSRCLDGVLQATQKVTATKKHSLRKNLLKGTLVNY